jgi:hypothetical protein
MMISVLCVCVLVHHLLLLIEGKRCVPHSQLDKSRMHLFYPELEEHGRKLHNTVRMALKLWTTRS